MDPLRVVVRTGTAYELLLSVVVAVDPSSRGRLDLASDLKRRARGADPEAIASLRRIGREPFISLLGWTQAMVEPPSAEALLAALPAADPRELRLAAMGYYRRAMRAVAPAAVMASAADADREAIRQLQRAWKGVGYMQATYRHLLGLGDAAFRDELSAALTAWYQAGFADLEPRLAADQTAGADRARELIGTRDLGQVLEILAPGMVFARELGQSLVVLVPSLVVRPSFALTDYGSTLVIAFPVAPGAAAQPDVNRLADLADALGDPIRVRALRELALGPLSTSELARRLGVPRTSLQHHVSVLLSAGLASMSVDDAAQGLLAIRRAAVAELASLAGSVLDAPRT